MLSKTFLAVSMFFLSLQHAPVSAIELAPPATFSNGYEKVSDEDIEATISLFETSFPGVGFSTPKFNLESRPLSCLSKAILIECFSESRRYRLIQFEKETFPLTGTGEVVGELKKKIGFEMDSDAQLIEYCTLYLSVLDKTHHRFRVVVSPSQLELMVNSNLPETLKNRDLAPVVERSDASTQVKVHVISRGFLRTSEYLFDAEGGLKSTGVSKSVSDGIFRFERTVRGGIRWGDQNINGSGHDLEPSVWSRVLKKCESIECERQISPQLHLNEFQEMTLDTVEMKLVSDSSVKNGKNLLGGISGSVHCTDFFIDKPGSEFLDDDWAVAVLKKTNKGSQIGGIRVIRLDNGIQASWLNDKVALREMCTIGETKSLPPQVAFKQLKYDEANTEKNDCDLQMLAGRRKLRGGHYRIVIVEFNSDLNRPKPPFECHLGIVTAPPLQGARKSLRKRTVDQATVK